MSPPSSVPSPNGAASEPRWALLVAGLAVLIGALLAAPPLYFVQGLADYLPLHMLLETASIVVAFLVFAVVWNAYSDERPGNIVILAIGLMVAGAIDFIHMLSYAGMPAVVTPSGPEKAINFWLVARLVTAAAFVAAAVREWAPLRAAGHRYWLLAAGMVLVATVYWAGLWRPEAWPRTFVEGEGLTPFKVVSEYVILALFALSAVILARRGRRSGSTVMLRVAAAAAISALSEFSFTLYADVTDTFNLLGHLYKVIAFGLVYSAVFVSSVREPFERLRAEEGALAESERRLQAVFEAAQDGIAVADSRTEQFIMVNETLCSMLGYSEEEMADLTISDIHPAQALEQVRERFRRQAAGELTIAADTPVLRRDGSVFYADFNSAPLEIDGRPALLGIVRDVTERRQMEQEIAAARERLELALHGARDGLFDWDLEQDRLYVSPRWKELIGYSESEIEGRFDEWVERLHPDDRGAVEADLESVLEGGEDYFSDEFRMRHKDGHWVWILGRGRVIRDQDGRPVRMVGTHVDITDTKEAQRREAEARATLQERVKELGCMYGVAERAFDLERPVEEVLQDVAQAVPDGWQWPESTSARIRWLGREYRSDGFASSPWCQAARLRVGGEDYGSVEVFVDESRAAGGQRPFLPEEDALVENIARELGHGLELREQEAALERVNRLLMTLSESNRSLVRAADEGQLTRAICNILVGNGDYSLAWVGYQDGGPEGLYQVAAATAPEVGCHEQSHARPGDRDALVFQALASGEPQRAEATDGVACPVCAGELPACRSGIALPLAADGTPFGILAVCGADPHGLAEEEVRLFEELADDLSYGINTLRTRQQRDRALNAYDDLLFQTIEAIALTVEKRDPYTAGHQKRVAALAAAIGTELGWADDRVRGLRLGATIHDVGKVYIPAEILNRPGRLTAQEFSLIQTHPEVGYEIIQGVDFPWPVGEMIRQHHERLDGSGYPRALAGEAVIPEARVLAVADVVEAVVAHRPYRPGLGIDKALGILREGRGTLFDPEAVDVCVGLFEAGRFSWEEVD